MMSTIERDVISTLTFYFHRTWCQSFIPHRIDIDQGSLLITRITFNLDMDKKLHPSWCVGWSIYLLPRFNDGAVKFGLIISNLSSSDSSSCSANTTRSSIIIIIITNNHSLKWNPRQDQRCSKKNIEKHTAHTIVSWPNPKQWVIVHTSDLMMIIRQSIYILSIITKEMEMGKLNTHSPHIV